MSPSGPGRSPAQKRQRMEVEGLRSRTGRRRRIELSWNWKWMQRKLCEELFENSSFSGYWKSDWFCYCIGNLAEIFQDSECSPHCTRILNKCFDLRMLREKHQTLWTLAFPLFFQSPSWVVRMSASLSTNSYNRKNWENADFPILCQVIWRKWHRIWRIWLPYWPIQGIAFTLAILSKFTQLIVMSFWSLWFSYQTICFSS